MSTFAVRDDDQQHPETLESPGKRLRIARQAKGMSQAQVAVHLHLSVAMIQALEDDQYDQLPGPVFVRGYIRNYARLLGLDDEDIVSFYDVGSPSELASLPAVRAGVRAEIRSSHAAVRLVTWVIVLGLIALLGLWWQGRLGWEDMLAERSTPETAAPAAAGDALPPPEPLDTLAAPDTVTPTPANPPLQGTAGPAEGAGRGRAPTGAPTEAPPGASPAPAVTAPVPAESAAEGVPKDQVAMEFMGACWVDVRDSSRKFKLFGEMRKGEKRVLEGTPPYSIILGNSPMVRITVGGKPFNTEEYTRGGVARFSLDPGAVGQ